ncbi:hypothetical protein EVJ24_07405 [Exiguobacterium sp. SH1S21]|uniref:hypothetical protein n=1 Tax=unclassified Exiguobacterium TaxID=2644629 RepID=UPI00103F36D3|nr:MULTISPECIES: hypothetical protein [unclassified Exiguobacterium]TCI54116.1 hypothetical protein EVJ24_07405 [Exiguobacterium sp. SH1S21]TCI69786.1 hypothetical protein EVJ22_09580 [Exiguobacterium sp. SH0S7]
MKILIGQPKLEQHLEQFIHDIEMNPSVDLILYPEGYCKLTHLDTVSELANRFKTAVVMGYRDAQQKDRALIMNTRGDIMLDRAKTPETMALFTPFTVQDDDLRYGYLLCREIFMGLNGLKDDSSLQIIFNPIGVGMFSEDQYLDWSQEAKKIAIQQQAIILGTSHADGSYRNCGHSIPIAFFFDETGEPILLSKDDTRTRIVDTVQKTVEVLDSPIKTTY